MIQENRLDLVVRLHTSLPPGKIGLARQPAPPGHNRGETAMGPNAGLTEVLIPAGFVRTAYDPGFVLSEDGTRYVDGPIVPQNSTQRLDFHEDRTI